MTNFPKQIFVSAGSPDDTGRDFFGRERLEDMNGDDGASDGDEVAVYELKTVQRVEVTRKLVDIDT